MKIRQTLCSFLLAVLCAASAHAQQTVPAPAAQSEALKLIAPLGGIVTAQGQRQGQRGGPALANANAGGDVQALLAPPLVWWTDRALVEELGISEVQRAKIQNAFETHRENLMSAIASIEKEETQLSRLLEREPLDRPAVLTQVNRVIQARADMTRISSTMALEIREQLTRVQWSQLQAKTAQSAQTPAAGGRGRGAIATPAAGTLPPGAVRVGPQAVAGNLVSNPAPQYPPLARAGKVQGAVALEVLIDKTGSIAEITLVSGHPLLTDAAIQAVRQWRYRPILMNGQPIDAVTTVTVNFTLQ